MKFFVQHTFTGIDLPGYETLYFDEEFNLELCRATALERSLLKREVVGNKIERVARIAPQRTLPAPIAKIFGDNTLNYTEYLEYELGSYVAHWHTEPSMLSDKIETYGVYRFVATPRGVQRIVDGVINVKIFGLGGIVERFVVADIEKSYGVAAAFTQRWLDKRETKA